MKGKKKIELLAPAGNFKALQAAVCAGANAVYLGLDSFNARRGADNFSVKSLKSACDYAHLRGVKIYLTLNIIVFEKEFDVAMQMAYDAWNAGVDAFIVQDLGIAKAIRQEIPDARLHISTQMNVLDESSLRFVAKLGPKRVTLARELSLEQIEHLCEVAKELDIEIETFSHGALCICYSGQCLMSSMIGGRSANRGMCAQACRLNYELVEGKAALGVRRYGEDDRRGQYLLSPKDLCTIEILPKLADAGVSSLKIEGRMKSAEYVFEVVSIYRKALNRMYKNGPENYSVSEKEITKLNEAFSRGFTRAYMEGKRGNEIMSYSRPNNRGINIGRVVKISNKIIVVSTKEKLSVGDVLEIWTKRGRSTLRVDKNTKFDGKDVVFKIDDADLSFKHVSISDRVFRVRSAQSTFEVNEFQPRVNINCKVELKIGSPAKISVWNDKFNASLEFDNVEAAKTKAVTSDEVVEHIKRTGQTPFNIENIEVNLDENVGIGFSSLHHMRTEVLSKLQNIITDNNRVSLEKRNGTSLIGKQKIAQNCNLVLSSDLFESESFCDNISDLYSALNNGIDVEIGPHIPIVNRASLEYAENLGAKRIWLSPELSLEQIKDITSAANNISFGIYILGATELMISKHCFLMSEGPCNQDCKNCNRRKKDYHLIDRKGYEFPTKTDELGRGHIYNSTMLDICHCISELKEAGVDSFLVDTTIMDQSEAEQSIARAMASLESNVEKSKNTTTGHLFRKVI